MPTIELTVDEVILIERLYKKLRPTIKEHWVRVKTIKQEFNLNDEQIRYRRQQAESIGRKVARQKESGQYEYNIEMFRELFSAELKKTA
jgi:hypothetical protein